MQNMRVPAWILAALICAGCSMSGGSQEKVSVQAATQENADAPSAAPKPADPAKEEKPPASEEAGAPGIAPSFHAELDRRSTLDQVRSLDEDAMSDGTKMLLALRMAESEAALVPEAIERIEALRARQRDCRLEDVFDYHLGRLYAFSARNLGEDAAKEAGQKALDAFSAVMRERRSPYYHLAYAEKMRLGIETGADVVPELRRFVATYPDYPGLNDFKIALATRDYDGGMAGRAEESVQDIAYFFPWSASSQKARRWLDERNLAPKARSFEEVFARVDTLRKARFWDDAEKAAKDAMARYPESYQLMVQHARIAYERSHHEEAVRRFEAILEKLGGETKDGLRPAGVIAYIYRAYGYMGDCAKALEYHAMNAAKLGKKDRARATMEFALTCGALDVAYDRAKTVYEGSESAEQLARFGFIAYLNGDYEAARAKFATAMDGLSGAQKRRAEYFGAQATLKSALGRAGSGEDAETAKPAPAEAKKDAGKASKKSSKKPKKSKKGREVRLAPATLERAKSQFQALIDADSGDYYAILAHSRLSELDRGPDAKAPPTPVIQTFGDVAQEPDDRRPWGREFSFDEKKPLETFGQNVEKFQKAVPELCRVEFLHDAELYMERNALFRTLAIEILGISMMSGRPSGANLWTTKLSLDGHLVDNRKNKTGVWGCELTDYHFTLPSKKEKEARVVIAARQAAIYDNAAELRPFVREMLAAFHDYYMARRQTPVPNSPCGGEKTIDACSTLYPHAFSHAVIDASLEHRVSPELIWAVMNIESAFNPDSISHASAYGLLQIIPMTGYKIAQAKRMDGFGPYDLIRPEASISMGTWYFAQILKKFHGYATLSMAAYNGGPHQIARYMTAYAKKVEHDAFVELIPLNEARNYVKKGMARLLIFRRIDAQNPKAFFEIPNTLPESFEEMPNY